MTAAIFLGRRAGLALAQDAPGGEIAERLGMRIVWNWVWYVTVAFEVLGIASPARLPNRSLLTLEAVRRYVQTDRLEAKRDGCWHPWFYATVGGLAAVDSCNVENGTELALARQLTVALPARP